MSNEKDLSTSPPPKSPPESVPNAEHEQWQTARLVAAVLVCLFIIGAALVYEKLG